MIIETQTKGCFWNHPQVFKSFFSIKLFVCCFHSIFRFLLIVVIEKVWAVITVVVETWRISRLPFGWSDTDTEESLNLRIFGAEWIHSQTVCMRSPLCCMFLSSEQSQPTLFTFSCSNQIDPKSNLRRLLYKMYVWTIAEEQIFRFLGRMLCPGVGSLDLVVVLLSYISRIKKEMSKSWKCLVCSLPVWECFTVRV